MIKKVIAQIESEDGGSRSGSRKRAYQPGPDFDPRTFGSRKLSDLVRKTNVSNRSAERWIHANSDHEAGRITPKTRAAENLRVRDEAQRKQSIITGMAAVRFWHKATGWLKTPIR